MEGEGAERIRRREVQRTLKSARLSLGEEEAVERMSRTLVDRLIRGPISRALEHTEGGTSGRQTGAPKQ